MSIFTKLIESMRPRIAGGPAWKKYEPALEAVNKRRKELGQAGDDELKRDASITGTIAAAAVAAERVLNQRPFDVQVIAALAMVDGKIAEMQTGEGKTLAAALAVAYLARQGAGFHVLTANDYLARRDAEWMGGIYKLLDMSAGHIGQGMSADERRRAYACDVTYATANEVGFDYLRDGLVFRAEDVVERPFQGALVDEADSILIDEARIPLVIAGGEAPPQELAGRVERAVRRLLPGRDYAVDGHGRNVFLTDEGLRTVEAAAGCPDLYSPANEHILAAVQNALHAAALLHRDVDYVVKNGRIELVDELKGRIAENRRWPAGLQTALEAKENVALQMQGRVLGSITLQNLMSLYPKLCGMTGTAGPQAKELKEVYELDVVRIPTRRPVIRVDHPDVVFATRAEKDSAVIREIVDKHATGQPILVGTASVAESERLSAQLARAGVPHEVLNARNDERESRIVARAGSLGAVTISTNMAGRGTDIPLGGDNVRNAGGLYVIGTNRHESRRIDDQLRGRSGRQGDPGLSRFFVSLEDDLLERYGISDLLSRHSAGESIDAVQRIIGDEHLGIRRMLWKYEFPIEQQRNLVRARRAELLTSGAPASRLNRIDELWADHLALITELRDGLCWIALGGKDPFSDFLHGSRDLFDDLLRRLDDEAPDQAADARAMGRGATWTYLVNDQPFGTLTERFFAGLRRRLRDALRSGDTEAEPLR